MSGNSAFVLVQERGWRRGLRTLLDNELARWWRTNMWWVQSLIWIGIVGFMLGAVIFGAPDVDMEAIVTIYGFFGGIGPAIAVIIIMQDVLVGEKETGTAAWVLSKPVSRQAFILARLIAHTLGVLVTMVVIPGIVAYLLMALGAGITIQPLRFLAALGVLFLNHLFFLTLTLMLGALFRERGAVIGLSLAFLFLQQYLGNMLPPLRYALPWTLVGPAGNQLQSFVGALLLGRPVSSYLPVVVVALECVIFTAVALWRFAQEEL